MSFYGNRIKEALDQPMYTDEVLQEMNFSKKDLQDPKTLDKIIKRKESFESVPKYTSFLFGFISAAVGIASGTATSSIITGIGMFIVIANALFCVQEALKALPLKNFEKNNKKYESSVRKLMNKMEEKIKNPKVDNKTKAEAKKVLANCKKVLEVIEEKKKKEREMRFVKQVERAVDAYEELIKFLSSPSSFDYASNEVGFEDAMNIAKVLKIPESIIMKKIAEIDDRLSSIEIYSIKMDNEDPEKEYIIVDYISDDIIYFYDYSDTKKLYRSDCGKVIEIEPYDFAEGNFDYPAIIEADRQLGYYIMSYCPDQVKKKEFPVKF